MSDYNGKKSRKTCNSSAFGIFSDEKPTASAVAFKRRVERAPN